MTAPPRIAHLPEVYTQLSRVDLDLTRLTYFDPLTILLLRTRCRLLSKSMASAAPRPEPWKSSGVVRGPGIPMPSGPYAVGCVDLMHRFEDENDGLLVRLFYPTAAVREGRRPRYEYANWIMNKRYVKGYLEYSKTSAVGFKAALVGAFLSEFAHYFHAASQ